MRRRKIRKKENFGPVYIDNRAKWRETKAFVTCESILWQHFPGKKIFSIER